MITRFCVLATAALVLSAATPPLEDGHAIPVGTAGGTGPLSAGLTSTPVGCARIFGSTQPDLFVATGRHTAEPGIFLYRWTRTAADGTPVFGERVKVACPYAGKIPPVATVFEGRDGVYGVFIEAGEVVCSRYDKGRNAFAETARMRLADLPRPPGTIAVLPNPDGSVELLMQISDGVRTQPEGVGSRHPQYFPYDGAGISRGGLPYLALYAVTLGGLTSGSAGPPRLVSGMREVLWRNDGMTVVKLAPDRVRDVISGSWFGDLYYYRNGASRGVDLERRRHVIEENGNAVRHPSCGASPMAYPDARTGLSNLIAGGEGALYFYRFTGRFGAEGRPVFRQPVPVLEDKAPLYAGSLPVPSLADWDGDGALDIVSGNSEGRVLFFRNGGTSAQPLFANGVPIRAGDEEIHVEPGYKGDIQGPGEARWGYVSPTVVDWNGDGLPDLVMGDSLARHTVYLNRGKRGAPRLAPARPLYLDGLDLHGTWRVKPGAARMGDRMAYAVLDDEDQFHLYWRIDDYNLEDGGKLRLEDGTAIGANFLHAGGTGRTKINLVDWDEDGTVDIVAGTPRHGSVPDPKRGLPQSLGLPGAAVLFLKNVGTNARPVFRRPEVMRHKGEPVYFGQHECGPAVGRLGEGGLNLVVGQEEGRFLFFRRENLSPRLP